MAGGRPNKFTVNELSELLLEWVQLPDSINLLGFVAWLPRPCTPQYIMDKALDSKEFSEIYHYAKAVIGARREGKLNKGELSNHAFAFNALTYDAFAKKTKKSMMKFESSLKAQEQETVSQSAQEQMNALLSQIRGAQAKASQETP